MLRNIHFRISFSLQLLEEGHVWLQPANVSVSLTTASHILLFRAHANHA